MTAGRRIEARCGRCKQVVTFVTTGFDYGPMFFPEEHLFMDDKQRLERCSEPPVLFKNTVVEFKPMDLPTTKLLDLEYRYRKLE